MLPRALPPPPVPQTPLAGQVALVTGGSRGIGAAIARTLAGAGATVAINYRSDRQAAERVAAECGTASLWPADVADAEAVEAMVREVGDAHGRLDIAVANAGVWHGGPVDELDPRAWREVLDTSLGGAFNLARAVTPPMRAAGYGRFVAIGSVIGLVGFPGDAAYAAAKAGLVGFVRSLAKEVGRDGVTANVVAPGFVETDMTAAVSDRSRERLLQRAIIRRPGHPDEVAAAVRYLACDGAYVTGQVLVVDGGLVL
jgi:3-oxoacyl-[acyl-carrier protein] reductase